MLSIDLTDRVALVTGGSSQLGRAISRTLADCGAAIAIHYIRGEDRARTLAGEICEGGGKAIVVRADVSDQDSVAAMREAMVAQLGAPDIIVTNAVHQYDWAHVLDQDPADYESQYQTCTLQNVLMAQAFAPAMIKQRWGRIIAINTECTMQCGATMSAYVSGKGGQDRMLRVLAKEIGEHQVTVNQVAPGWMISDSQREAGTEIQPDYEKTIPLNRRGDDQDIANTVAFLSSDLAAFITGAYVPVCGGNVMPCV